MGRPAQDITESELAVLRILWDRETATIRQLTDVLYPQGEAAQYATVQKLLDRMETKGYVRRDRTMFVHVFRSVLDRDELIGRRLRSLAEMLCEGSLTPLLTHLARATDLTDEDRLALRAVFDEPDSDRPGSRPQQESHRELAFGHAMAVALTPDGQWAGRYRPLMAAMSTARRLIFHGIARINRVKQRIGCDRSRHFGRAARPRLPAPRVHS